MTAMSDEDSDIVVGCTDGFRLGYIEGWAWRPNRPHDTVTVQLLVDGLLAGEVSACLPRPDLSTAGIGHGQHAFAIPLVIEPDSPPVLHLTIRVKDGPVLPSGEIDFATSEETRAELALRRSLDHLETVFGRLTAGSPQPPRPAVQGQVSCVNFILYATRAAATPSSVLGAPEYSYLFVMHGFREVLRRLGVVHVVKDPADADGLYQDCLARGESCLLLSFTPPQTTPLGLRCPTIPVIAWEFGSIPTGGPSSETREDWRFVLRQTGRAVTISSFAAKAIRATMGADFPVAFIPTPVWDRQAKLRARLAGSDAMAPGGPVALEFDGFVWDSREVELSPGMRPKAPPSMPKRPPVATSPMRGALLALAEASAAERDMALAALPLPEPRAKAGDTLGGPELAATFQATPALPIADDPEPLSDISEPSVEPKAIGRKMRITAYLVRQWYREVVRDTLPSPLAAAISKAGRAVLGGKPGPSPDTRDRHTELSDTLVPPPMTPDAAERDDVESANHAIEPIPVAVQPNPAEASATPASTDPALPPTVLYLPVGDPRSPGPARPRPRYAPASDMPPLPEAELAVFVPSPFASATGDSPRRETVALQGMVFTAVLSPKDGRKNWQDILTAFCTSFRDTPDATLVLKMIGADAAFWWWEFHDIAKALPRFSCRVVVINAFLDEENYAKLIAATHFVVNASLAEGQCLPLVEFMAAGRPAIAPLHTAMLDYITIDNALMVKSTAEFCSFPHDALNMLTTTRHRIEWPSLCLAYSQAASIIRTDPVRLAGMAQSARCSMRDYCADAVVGPALASFLGLGDQVVTRAGWRPRPRDVAEPLLAPIADSPLSVAVSA